MARFRVFGLLLLGLVAAGAAHGATVRMSCADGDAQCDADRSCNGGCGFAFCQVQCLVAPCPEIFYPCVPAYSDAVTVRVDLAPGGRGRRQVGTLGLTRYALRCRPPRRGTCKPRITSGCRPDLGAEECAAHDGDFGTHGLFPEPSCLCRTDDGGTLCRRETQCQGMCAATLEEPTVGRCTAHVVEFGCFVRFDEQGRSASLCVD